MRPLVSVIFPCYNAEKFLAYSLESIMNQHYNNLEIICINDGSTDSTLSLLKEYQTADTRIKIIDNIKNLGLIESLNNALKYVNGGFFARADADDYCEPERFSKQVRFLQQHLEYDLVSSGYQYFEKDNKRLEYIPPVGYSPGALKFISLFSTPVAHAAVLARRSLIERSLYQYDKNFRHSEDFELFSRLAWQGILLGNMPEPLYWVRVNPESVSVKHNAEQIETHLKITQRNLTQNLGIQEQQPVHMLQIICNRINEITTINEVEQAMRFLNSCFELSQKLIKFSEEDRRQIRHYLNLHKLNIIVQSNKAGFIKSGASNTPYLLRSLSFIRPPYVPLLAKKILNFVKYRII